MSPIPRLNGIIKALESNEVAVCSFAEPDASTAVAMSMSPYDGVVFEAEHHTWNVDWLRESLQFLLNRKQIVESGSVAPAVTPIVRIPVNGVEMSQVYSKQALDLGFYGVVCPRIDDVSQAYNAVAACRYPRSAGERHFEPQGIRGDGPTRASRYWGLSSHDYYERADVWPLAPDGEVLVVLMIESTKGIRNLSEILENVPGVGAVLIGESSLSQELGHRNDGEHPEMVDVRAEIVGTCKRFDVAVGHSRVNEKNVERMISEGFRLLMVAPIRSYPGVDLARKLSRR